MKLFKISQDKNNDYDTYDSAIVCAYDKEDAKMIHPSKGTKWDGKDGRYSCWCKAEDVKVEYIGKPASKLNRGVIIASFNAG